MFNDYLNFLLNLWKILSNVYFFLRVFYFQKEKKHVFVEGFIPYSKNLAKKAPEEEHLMGREYPRDIQVILLSSRGLS